jgi:histidine triad (HIT) family protein
MKAGGEKLSEGDCLFCKIANQEIPAKVVFEDDKLVAIEDVDPVAPVHILLIPKSHQTSLNEMTEDDIDLLGHIQLTAAAVAKQLNVAEEGYRLLCNCGPAGGQAVIHVHYHLLGGRDLGWPPG